MDKAIQILNMNSNVVFAMTFSKIVLQWDYSRKQYWPTSVQKHLCQFELYHVGNFVNLCQYGKGFLLIAGSKACTSEVQGSNRNLSTSGRGTIASDLLQ
jgi:hypothetical protein